MNKNGRIFVASNHWYLIMYQFGPAYFLQEISQTPILNDNIIDCLMTNDRQWYVMPRKGLVLQIEEPVPDLCVSQQDLLSMLTHRRSVEFLMQVIMDWQPVCPIWAKECKDPMLEYFQYLTGKLSVLSGLSQTP